MSLDAVADALAEQGVIYSSNAIGAWERGERMPSPCVLFNLSNVFGCSIYSLFYATTVRSQHIAQNVNQLEQRHQQSLVYLAETWSGNVLPLIQADRAYSMLPPKRRAAVVDELVNQINASISEGSFGDELSVDIDAIIDGVEKLKNGGGE